MCIPIELDVPVLTVDRREIGIAREIICACPGESISDGGVGSACGSVASAGDELWLRATRPGGPDLYIPFAEIAETRADGVRLRVESNDRRMRAWEQVPVGVPLVALGARGAA